jgi:pimeloyl-ACP methyl ester carboxylesterase
METRTVSTDLGDLTIREWGETVAGAERLLLAVHPMDIDSSGAVFDGAVDPLADAGHHVVAPDLPGFGLTPAVPPAEYDVARLADRLWSLADALGSSRITVAGQGWGAHLAARMAMESPAGIAALVLIDGGHRDQPDTAPADISLTLDQWLQRARDVRSGWPAGAPGIASAEALGAAAYHFSSFRVTSTWPAIAEEGLPVLLLVATEPPEVADQNLRDAHTFQAVVRQAVVRPASGATHRMVQDVSGGLGLFVAEWLATLP